MKITEFMKRLSKTENKEYLGGLEEVINHNIGMHKKMYLTYIWKYFY